LLEAMIVLPLLLAIYWCFATFGALAAAFGVVISCGEGWCDDGRLQYDLAVALAIASVVCASLVIAKRRARPQISLGLFAAQVGLLALAGQILDASDAVRVSPELAMLVAGGHVPGLVALVRLARDKLNPPT
jgi:hypothetical protein